MAKDEHGFQKGLDPAVASMLSRGEARKEERSLPRDVRKKAKRSKERQKARNGSRAVYDMDPDVIEYIKNLAAENGTTASQVAEIALRSFRRAIQFGEIDLEKYKRPLVNNPRYEYELVWEE